MRHAGFAFAAVATVALTGTPCRVLGAEAATGGGPALTHRIRLDVRGPLALVEVTRTLAATLGPSGGSEALLDLALPDGSALGEVAVREGERWRPVETSTLDRAASGDLYRSESAARGVTAADEPFDDSASFRLRVARARESSGKGIKAAPLAEVRYRFASTPTFSNGRYRIRFPAAPERLPVPAEVTVATPPVTDVEIAGARATMTATNSASGRASTRSGWEISWAPRDPTAAEGPALDARLALAPVSTSQTAVAYAVRNRAGRGGRPPSSVLFLIDRSRSVGLAGLSAERDLAHRLLEALPPTVRFDVLFFDRGTQRLFPMSRPATREAIDSLEAAMVPSSLANGTDLAAALAEAGGLLRREAMAFGPRALLAVITDGALPDGQDGGALDHALGKVTGLDLDVATFVVRPPEDDPAGATARQALRAFAGARGGVARDLPSSDIGEVVPAAVADVEHGGDLTAVRLVGVSSPHLLLDSLAPGEGSTGVVVVPGHPSTLAIEATIRGARASAHLHPARIASDWSASSVAPSATNSPKPRLLRARGLVALVEPVERTPPTSEPVVRGSMDRLVMRNVLSLAYMPRARACYLGRTGATAALRDLQGRVRIAIDVARGEVERVAIEASSLGHADVERCLREGAFAIEVPRAVRSDAPARAILNLVFRPHPPEKKSVAELGAVGDQIDLIIEAQRREEAEASGAGAPNPGEPRPAPPTLPAP